MITTPNNPIFEAAIAVVLQHEGGLSDDKNDPGGLTNYGISTTFMKANNLHLDLKQLTKDQAKFLYYKYFWLPYHFQQLTNQEITVKLFDTTVNIGPIPAINMAQHIAQVAIDGIIGPITAGVLNAVNSDDFLSDYRLALKHYYLNLVITNPKLDIFLNGWLQRAAS